MQDACASNKNAQFTTGVTRRGENPFLCPMHFLAGEKKENLPLWSVLSWGMGGEGYFFPLLILRAQRKCEGRCGADGAIVQFFMEMGTLWKMFFHVTIILPYQKYVSLKKCFKILFTYVKAMCGTREEGHTGPITLSFFFLLLLYRQTPPPPPSQPQTHMGVGGR